MDRWLRRVSGTASSAAAVKVAAKPGIHMASKPVMGKSVNLRTTDWTIDRVVVLLHCMYNYIHTYRPLPPFERPFRNFICWLKMEVARLLRQPWEVHLKLMF